MPDSNRFKIRAPNRWIIEVFHSRKSNRTVVKKGLKSIVFCDKRLCLFGQESGSGLLSHARRKHTGHSGSCPSLTDVLKKYFAFKIQFYNDISILSKILFRRQNLHWSIQTLTQKNSFTEVHSWSSFFCFSFHLYQFRQGIRRRSAAFLSCRSARRFCCWDCFCKCISNFTW